MRKSWGTSCLHARKAPSAKDKPTNSRNNYTGKNSNQNRICSVNIRGNTRLLRPSWKPAHRIGRCPITLPSTIARQPRTCQCRTRRLRKALGEMSSTPTFLAPTLHQTVEISLGCGVHAVLYRIHRFPVATRSLFPSSSTIVVRGGFIYAPHATAVKDLPSRPK